MTEQRFAWARLNSDGLLLVGLMILQLSRLGDAENTVLYQALGRMPTLLPFWIIGIAVAGLLIGWGFFANRVLPELFGRGLLVATLLMQTVDTAFILGQNSETYRAITVFLIVLLCSALRTSVLLSRRGVAVIVPGVEPPTGPPA